MAGTIASTGAATPVGLADSGQQAQFGAVIAKLSQEYGKDRGEEVRRVVAEELLRFVDATVRAYVPILVERAARTRLGPRPV